VFISAIQRIFRKLSPFFQQHLAQSRNIDEVVEYCSNRRKRQTMDTIALQGGAGPRSYHRAIAERIDRPVEGKACLEGEAVLA